jgi:putative intracellular protease/amidase
MASMEICDDEPVNVGIVLYDQVEELDFVGPYETFKAASFLAARHLGRDTLPLKVFTLAQTSDLVATSGGLRIQPDYSFASCPSLLCWHDLHVGHSTCVGAR